MPSITPEKLEVGLFIHIDHSWKEHPFLRNSFQITSAKDIQAIREHGLTKISFDPGKSSPEAMQLLQQASEAADNAPSDGIGNQVETLAAKQNGESAQTPPAQDGADTPIGEVTTAMRREAIEISKQAYNNAVTNGRAMYNIMAKDPEKGLAMATELIASMQDDSRLSASAVCLACTTTPSSPQDEALMHSLNVAAISMLLGRDLGLSPEDLGSMGLGALLLGLGTEAIDKLPPLPESASDVIQHCRNEKAGPNATKATGDKQPTTATEIVSVVKTYDDFTNSSKNDGTHTPTDALSRLYKETTDGRSREIATALICTMTIYPPGSYVRLTDTTVSLVISPNPENRMKPLVLRYTPDVPSDEALFIDLMQEAELSIQQHVSRASLPPEVVTYLNPSNVNGYAIPPSPKVSNS